MGAVHGYTSPGPQKRLLADAKQQGSRGNHARPLKTKWLA